ncbi:MAG: PBSX family phage terminase large subunit [Luteimonas sp.]
MSNLGPEVALQLPVKLLPILQPRRFKVLHGGRGGAKSHTVAQVLLMRSMQHKLRILCVREVQKSLAQSSKRVLEDYIERLGLSAYFAITKKEEDSITCLLTGSTFSFSGLKDYTADSIKSWEGCDIVWVEEAHSVSANSWNVLIPTIRKAGSEIWITFNPDQADDYVYLRFVVNTDPNAWVCEINWRDNPWFGSEMDDERRQLKAVNDDLYQHVWEGKCRSAAGLMFKRAWFKWYDTPPERLNLYMASDYAVTEDGGDFTEHGIGGLDHSGDLWLVDWWYGQTAPATWIDAAVALLRRHKPHTWFEEAGVILRSQDGAISKAMLEQRPRVYIHREALPSAGNKATRAMGFAARASMGTVWLPKGEAWAERLVNQLCAFTGEPGRTDDGVDVCSLLARGLDQMGNAGLPEQPVIMEIVPFTEQWIRDDDRDNERAAAERRRFYG